MKSSYNSFLDNIEVNEKELQRDLQKRKNEEQRRRLNRENENHYIKPQNKVNVNSNSQKNSNANKNTSNKSIASQNSSNKTTSSRPTTNKTSTNRNLTSEQTGNVKSRDANGVNSSNNYNNTTKPKPNQQANQSNVGTRNNTTTSRDLNVRKENNQNITTSKQETRQQNNQQRKDAVKIENAKGNVRKVTQLNNINGTQEPRKSVNKENNSEQTNIAKHRRHITKERLKNEKIHLRQRKIDNVVKNDDSELVEKQTFTISKEEYDQKILGTIKDNQTKMIFLKESQKLAKVPKSVAFLGIYAFILSAVILYSFSRIGTVKVQLRELNSEFNELSEVNAQLNIKLATAYNIDNIRQRAENELYMNKPEAHQIMYITVVPENNVEYEMGTNNE